MKLQIEKAVYGGAGLGYRIESSNSTPSNGPAVFVPFTLSGEIVEAEAIEPRQTFTEARLLRVITPSRERTAPRCAHFGACGGCHYQHATYSEQTALKQSILIETLHRAGLSQLPKVQLHTAEPWQYRNRTRLRLAHTPGNLEIGYNRRASNEFLPIHECPILSPLLWRAATALQKLAREDTPAARLLETALEAELFTNPNEAKLQLTLFVHKPRPGLKLLCERLKSLVPELAGASVALLSTQTQRRAQKPRPLEAWGAEGLQYRAGGEDYWISRGGFFQINRFLIDTLIDLVTSNRSGALAWDLYAGAGLFSRPLTRTFTQVVAVEAAADDLANSFKGPGRHAIASTTLDFLAKAAVQRDRPDLIVMDPPRAGVGSEACAHLAKIAAPEIVYVSCDPTTLARDLAYLTTSGYTLAALHLIDLFPQTFHLETIAVLRR